MFLFCVLALVLGAVLATVVSVIYLAVGLIVLTVAGAIEAYWIGVPLRAVQRSLLNVMENIDLRPPRAVAKRS
jgi:hypothetical protein